LNASSFSAFPSRLRHTDSFPRGDGNSIHGESYELSDRRRERIANPADPSLHQRLAMHTTTVAAVRRQAAAPPIYLLAICALPTFAAVFIASTRWFDFRHHGFDILFGFFIGVLTAIFAFRYYHLPISQGAGWAWGPRSADKAFWAGVGSYSYATDRMRPGDFFDDDYVAAVRPGDEEEALEAIGRTGSGAGSGWGHASEERAVGRKPSPSAADRRGTVTVTETNKHGSGEESREESRFGTAI